MGVDSPNLDALQARRQFLTAKETFFTVIQAAELKASYSCRKVILLGCFGGMLVSMGCMFALIVYLGSPGLARENPGLAKLLYGAVFPVALIMVVITGAELFTSNVMSFPPAVLMGRVSMLDLVKNLSLVYLSNFAASLLCALFLGHLTGLYEAEPWQSGVRHLAEHKVEYGFGRVFLRGIGCNFLVCLAAFLGMAAQDNAGKILGIFFPTMAFAAIGFEHCVANMFMIPLGMMEAAEVSVGEFIWYSQVPSTLGNFVGGAFFVGILNWLAVTGGALNFKRIGLVAPPTTLKAQQEHFGDLEEARAGVAMEQWSTSTACSTFGRTQPSFCSVAAPSRATSRQAMGANESPQRAASRPLVDASVDQQ